MKRICLIICLYSVYILGAQENIKNPQIIIPQENYFSKWNYIDDNGNGIGDFEFWSIVSKNDKNNELILPGKIATISNYTFTILSATSLCYLCGSYIFDYEMNNNIEKTIPIFFFSTYLFSNTSKDIKKKYAEKAAHNYNMNNNK